jgi:hypothetical protein
MADAIYAGRIRLFRTEFEPARKPLEAYIKTLPGCGKV